MPKKAKVKIKKEKKPTAKPKKKSLKTRQPKKEKNNQKEELMIKKEDIIIPKIEEEIKTERDKRFILWSGVIFFMILIFIFWIFNIKNTLKVNQDKNYENLDFKSISNDFNESIEQMKDDLAELKEFTAPKAEEKTGTTTPTDSVKQNDIFELKERLRVLESKIATSTESDETINSPKN